VRVVVAAALILLIVVIVLAAAVIVTQTIRGTRLRRRGWELDERSDGELVALYASKPGGQDLPLGSVPVTAPDFEVRLYELRAEASERVRVLNDRELR
jgi:hypothetical protein